MPHHDLTLTPAGPALAPRFHEPHTPAGPALNGVPSTERPARTGPYRRLFATPGARAFTLGNLIARLPMGMFGVSAVIMIAGAYGSYALAGAVTATGMAATAVVAPWTARLVDRHGQARIAVPATALAALGSLALLLCVHHRAPVWTLFAAYAATATCPNTGGMSRARWAHLHRNDPAALHTANAFEQAVDELCFMLGPVLAAFLCAALFPEAGTLAGAVLLFTGVLVFAAQRSTEPPVTPRSATTPGSLLRVPGTAPLLGVFLATGAVFGAMEVVTLAHVDGPLAGPVLALQATGSCVAGLVYGRRGRAVRLRSCLLAMTCLMTLPFLGASTGSLLALAAGLLVAGMATAPTLVTGMALVQRLTPPGRLNEGMTLAVTALLAGIAVGSATGGWTAENAPSTVYAFLVPATAAALALVQEAARGKTEARRSS
ncbi:MFS transporter [Streptomyces sp. Je 1-79]|uniref:MFS transporter n=1 Tax=Streptomyces sp. Je 1-79 TaxID=2943847 RepID=UPI0021A70AFE|nr:MFS transporter [Streptomyces sp. Je 1-79]MCT4355995.1 MFS transporter [Streptomyces sp. Je 1-79]